MKPFAENVLIALSLLAGLALLVIAWKIGDGSEAAQTQQWELAFLGFSLLLAGQWIVGATPSAKRQQMAAACAAFAIAGVGVESYYGIAWAQSTPFIVSFIFLFLAAETCAFAARNWRLARAAGPWLRVAAVVWNVAWGLFYLRADYGQLPDAVNLYIAFAWLWTAATAFIAWSELRRISDIAPQRAGASATKHDDLSKFSRRAA